MGRQPSPAAVESVVGSHVCLIEQLAAQQPVAPRSGASLLEPAPYTAASSVFAKGGEGAASQARKQGHCVIKQTSPTASVCPFLVFWLWHHRLYFSKDEIRHLPYH